MKLLNISQLLLALTASSNAFQVLSPLSSSVSTTSKNFSSSSPSSAGHVYTYLSTPTRVVNKCLLQAKIDDDNDDEKGEEEEVEKVENPYADPNYPDLEFVNYDDPEYEVDQGITDEFFDTDEKVEEMREERRRKNDEFQFETYHANTLKSGDKYKGEWTIYRTSTFLDGLEDDNDDGGNVDSPPQFRKERRVRKVVSNGKKLILDNPPEGGFEFRVDGECIIHEERLAQAIDFEDDDGNDDEWTEYQNILGNFDPSADGLVGGNKRYFPEKLMARDFRGEGGIMCVGNCYTICDSVPLKESEGQEGGKFDGPFSELRTEVGIQYKRMRFRVKWDYRVKEDETTQETPALYLYSMIVCRETRERWPRYETKSNVDDSFTEPLFGAPGAPGGLYDPPLVGSDEQAMQYMLLDLDGYASTLFPYKIDQDPQAHDGNGWVQSLDWSPGRIRFQADRKVLGGKGVRGLKTLELSEVEAASANQWRPKDDGQDMRQ